MDIARLDFWTGQTSVFELHDRLQGDDHDSPAILVRPDGRILACYAKHGSDRFSRWRMTVRPGDTSQWEVERSLTLGAGVTYSNLHHLAAADGLRGISSRSGGTDSKGIFQLWGVGAGRYLVQARMKESLATKIIDPANPGESPIRMVLQPTWPVALDNTKMSTRRILTAVIRDSQGRIVYRRYLHIPYRFETRLPAGRYTFKIFDGIEETQTGSFSVAKGGSVSVKVHG